MQRYSEEEADRLGAFDETALSLDEALAAEVWLPQGEQKAGAQDTMEIPL